MKTKLMTLQDATGFFRDGMTIMVGGFMGIGTPSRLVEALLESGVRDLTLIANDTAFVDTGIGPLIVNGRVRKVIASHIGTNPETGRRMISGEMDVVLVPQGTLIEQIRCGGAGLGGFLTWGGGFSGSMPLLAATPGNPVEHIAGLIPVGDTLFSGFNIFITVALIVVMPFITRMMMPKPSDVVSIDPKLLMEEADFQKQLPKDAPPSERLEESRILTLIIGALGIAYLAMYFSEHGFNITINTVNLMFMIAGLLLHKTPMAYMRAISAAARSTAGILVQFPFYAGIQLMMEHSGLGGLITEFFINVANKDTFPVMTFFSSALINFAVPSGGGHWVIQGPFVIPAAQALGADLGKSVMAIAYGEQWMNMAQPFWALPALAIAGLGVRDIMGYCITALLFSGVIFVIGLTLF
ncbi:acetate CoA-transferase subunit alpha [Escherichia coli UMEA 3889-1]|nr:acetate CoA-transferase subunit alpha [Escherichia coli UMEA 3889-1]